MSVFNFSWVIPGKLGGCALPNFARSNAAAWLSEQGVDMLVSFTMPPGPVKEECERNGIEWVYFPVEDFDVPGDFDAFADVMGRVLNAVKDGRGVCMHCAVGIGRTGMGLSCAVGKYLGLPADKAIATVRKARPGSVEMPGQEDFVKMYLEMG